MQKIIFLTLTMAILAFIIYLIISAIKQGLDAKNNNKDLSDKKDNFINEVNKLNELLKTGALTKEEFVKAKKKFLEK
ncbi:SHOCT domain-containing protein [Candidatus Pelagibacter sp.]|nr:SHOCT domain-containing protein [Candidatus Pelagibacter sp.]MDA9663501.1 SHOCT domain-containing protein [Candidatus Pelagibacter sp.]